MSAQDGHPVHTDKVAWIDGGVSHVGTDRPEIKTDGESPARKTRLKHFGMSKCATTNRDFARFVDETGYVTDAERLGWSYVFRGLLGNANTLQHRDLPWWAAVDDASWKTPFGPGIDRSEIEEHPVVHVSFNDANAYAAWAGGRLPSEAEWEHAARGGLHPARYPWGEDEPSDYNFTHCNIWQGQFPVVNSEADGYYGTAPVDSFAPNSLGIFNMAGNVWEWTADPFRIKSIGKAAKARNAEAKRERERVLKGGSFLCHSSYCWRYRIAARSGRQPDNSTSNCGFRLAFDPPDPKS